MELSRSERQMLRVGRYYRTPFWVVSGAVFSAVVLVGALRSGEPVSYMLSALFALFAWQIHRDRSTWKNVQRQAAEIARLQGKEVESLLPSDRPFRHWHSVLAIVLFLALVFLLGPWLIRHGLERWATPWNIGLLLLAIAVAVHRSRMARNLVQRLDTEIARLGGQQWT